MSWLVLVAGLTGFGCTDDGPCTVTSATSTPGRPDTCGVEATCAGEVVAVSCVDDGTALDCACSSEHPDVVANYRTSAVICAPIGTELDAQTFLVSACVDPTATFEVDAPPPCERGSCCLEPNCGRRDQTCDRDVDSLTVDRCVSSTVCRAGRDVLGEGRDPGASFIELVLQSVPSPGTASTWGLTISVVDAPVLENTVVEWSDGGEVQTAVIEPSRTSDGGLFDITLPLPHSTGQAIRVVTPGIGHSNTICIGPRG